MKKIKSPPHLFRAVGLVSLAGLLAIQTALLGTNQAAYAAPLTDRSLTLLAGATDGGSKPGGIVNHKFKFTIPAGGSIGSIRFTYCTTAADVGTSTCVMPTGMTAAAATLGNEVGITGTTIHTDVANPNTYYLSLASLRAMGASSTVEYTINNVTNPLYGPTVPDTNRTFFVRIAVYSNTNATGTPLNIGTVAASINEPIVLDGTMPESLVFCTGETIGLISSLPDCSTATAGIIHFDQLFSPTDTATSNSQMAASTNAGSGYAITVNGTTLTSGSNTIAAMDGAANTGYASIRGTAQFGLNLKANTVTVANGFPGKSAEVAPAANGTNFKGWAVPSSGYDAIDQFRFHSGDVVAASSNGGLGGTDAQIYTVSYIANVPGSQPAGNYSTTLTYICTPTY